MKKPAPFARYPSPKSAFILPDQDFHGYINPEAPGDHPNFRSYQPEIMKPHVEEQQLGLPNDYPGPLSEDGIPLDPEQRTFEKMPPGYLRYKRWMQGRRA
jgi:hypothetical protein